MLPILSVGLAVVLAAAAALARFPQVVARQGVSNGIAVSAAANAAPPATAVDGNRLVAQAAEQLLKLPAIEAKTRQRIHLFDQQLVGSGTYFQCPHQRQLLLRMDLKLRVSDEVTSSLQQINDGHFFWMRRDLPHVAELSRVNLKRVQQAVERMEPVPQPAHWVALGGLPRLLATLAEQFDFSAGRPLIVGDGWKIWQVDGRWKPRILARLVRDATDGDGELAVASATQLPAHVPHGVTLTLGRDQVLPLFPYSVVFYRQDPAADTARTALVTLELFAVRLRTDLTPDFFEYRPGDQEVQDRTREFIAELTGKQPRKVPGRR